MNTKIHGGGALNGSASPSVIKSFDDMTDNELVAKYVKGDIPALTHLMKRINPLLYNIALKILRNQADAEEAVQDAWIQLIQKAAEIDGRQVLGLIAKMVKFRAIDLLRRNLARGNCLDKDDLVRDVLYSGSAGDVTEEVNGKDRSRILTRALLKIPEEQRQALVLMAQKYSQRDIARLTNTPLGTVKTRIALGMKKLGAMLLKEKMDGTDSTRR